MGVIHGKPASQTKKSERVKDSGDATNQSEATDIGPLSSKKKVIPGSVLQDACNVRVQREQLKLTTPFLIGYP